MSLEQYIDKKANQQLAEAVDIYRKYKQRFKIDPDVSVFGNYANVFTDNQFELFHKRCVRFEGCEYVFPLKGYNEFINIAEK